MRHVGPWRLVASRTCSLWRHACGPPTQGYEEVMKAWCALYGKGTSVHMSPRWRAWITDTGATHPADRAPHVAHVARAIWLASQSDDGVSSGTMVNERPAWCSVLAAHYTGPIDGTPGPLTASDACDKTLRACVVMENANAISTLLHWCTTAVDDGGTPIPAASDRALCRFVENHICKSALITLATRHASPPHGYVLYYMCALVRRMHSCGFESVSEVWETKVTRVLGRFIDANDEARFRVLSRAVSPAVSFDLIGRHCAADDRLRWWRLAGTSTCPYCAGERIQYTCGQTRRADKHPEVRAMCLDCHRGWRFGTAQYQ